MALVVYITKFIYIDFTFDVNPYIVYPFESGQVICGIYYEENSFLLFHYYSIIEFSQENPPLFLSKYFKM